MNFKENIYCIFSDDGAMMSDLVGDDGGGKGLWN